MKTLKEPKVLLMTKEYWMTSPFSIAKYYGGCTIEGFPYIVVNCKGQTLASLSVKSRSMYAIMPDEPADLIWEKLLPHYKKHGRDKILEILKEGKTYADIKAIKTVEKEKVQVKQFDMFENV